MSSLNAELYKVLSKHLGYYENNGKQLPAFTTDSPIAMDITGLEVTVGLPSFELQQIGNVGIESACVCIYLTQWPNGRQTILDAVRSLIDSKLAYSISATPVSYDHLKRYMVEMERLCIC
jgi:hypothetical protein